MQQLTAQTFKIFWQHTKKYGLLFWLSVGGIILANTAELTQPVFYKKFFDHAASPNASAGELVRIIILIASIAVTEWFGWRVATYASASFQSKTKRDLSQTCFNYLHKHSYAFFNNNFVGSLLRKCNRYDSAYEHIADLSLFSIFSTGYRILLLTGIVAWLYPQIALLIFAWTIFYILVVLNLNKKLLPLRLARAEADSKNTGFVADTIANNINIKVFASFGIEEKTFKNMAERLHVLRLKVWNYALSMEAVQGLLMIFLEFMIMYAAIGLWENGIVTVGGFALIQSYLITIYRKLWEIGRQTTKLYENIADANEMTEILVKQHKIKDAENATALKVTKGEVEFRKVDFAYNDGYNILPLLNCKINAKERVAIIGPSGGGKSTIIKLLLRLFDIQSGQILIDGQDICRVTQDSLRNNLSFVPQEPILFHRSLLENIRYGKPDASDEEVLEAAKKSHAHEFISKLKEGYGTFVGERGVKLSGGERQRVAIARAILKNAPILILDEATSSLDSESERYIQDALKELMKDKTVIVIAHRLSTIMQMDRILVVEKGTIVEQGRHEELIRAQSGLYQKLWGIQAGSFT